MMKMIIKKTTISTINRFSILKHFEIRKNNAIKMFFFSRGLNETIHHSAFHLEWTPSEKKNIFENTEL